VQLEVSENLLPFVYSNVKATSAPFELRFDASGNLGESQTLDHAEDSLHAAEV
jgi:hypothetical protein